MKRITSTSLLAAFMFFGMTACDDFLDVNDSLNQAEDAPFASVLTACMTSHIVAHEGEDARLACMWSRQFTGSDRQYSSYNVYNLNAEDFEWDKYYYGICEQAKVVIQKAEGINSLYTGIARILQAHSYGMLAAGWGDVPYAEANNFPTITNPNFDAQRDVYAGVQSILDQAIADLTVGGTDVSGVDFYFAGDAAKWIAVAYTLKARFYMHTGDHALAATEAAKGIISTDGDMIAPHAGGSYNQDQNMYYSFGVNDRQGYMTAIGAYLPSILDPLSGSYRGDSKTDESERFAWAFTNIDSMGTINWDLNYSGMWGATAGFTMVSAVENHLILAEAASRAGSNDDALTHLNNARAIVAGLFPTGTYDAYDLTDFDAGGIADNGQGDATGNLRYEIMEEKYISLMGQMEVFNDVRRTDNMLGLQPTSGGNIPERFLIPQDELNGNTNAPGSIPDIFVPTTVNQ